MKKIYESPRMRMIITHEDDKPIKVVYEDRTIEDSFKEYFKNCTGYDPDEVKWSDNMTELVASRKLTKSEVAEIFSDTRIGIWKL